MTGSAFGGSWRIYQSSSPSYLLMAGIDEAMRFAEAEGSQRLEKLLDMRELFLKQVESCRYIRVCPVTEPGETGDFGWMNLL